MMRLDFGRLNHREVRGPCAPQNLTDIDPDLRAVRAPSPPWGRCQGRVPAKQALGFAGERVPPKSQGPAWREPFLVSGPRWGWGRGQPTGRGLCRSNSEGRKA